MRPVVLASCAVALAATVLAGCGISSEDSARAIDPPSGSGQVPASATPDVSASGTVPETLFLVKDGLLVSVVRHVATEPTVDALVSHLVAGPSTDEREAGMTSALVGISVISRVRMDNGDAAVELSAGLEGASRNDEVLAFAQVVCTLTARPDVSGVYFVRDQKRLGVPRADGSLSRGPLTTADYASLIARR